MRGKVKRNGERIVKLSDIVFFDTAKSLYICERKIYGIKATYT